MVEILIGKLNELSRIYFHNDIILMKQLNFCHYSPPDIFNLSSHFPGFDPLLLEELLIHLATHDQ